MLAQTVAYAEKFAIAHELGHIIAGHVGLTSGRPEYEFEADDIALRIILSEFSESDAADTFELRVAIAGMNMLFWTVHFLELLLGRHSETHPAAAERRYRVLRYCERRYGGTPQILGSKMTFILENDLLKDLIPEWRARARVD